MGGIVGDQRQSSRYEFLFLASRGGGLSYQTWWAHTFPWALGVCWGSAGWTHYSLWALSRGLMEKPVSHPLRTDRCVIPPGVVEWACNDDWFWYRFTLWHACRDAREASAQTQTETCCDVSNTTPRELLSVAGSTWQSFPRVNKSLKCFKWWNLVSNSINSNGKQGRSSFNLDLQIWAIEEQRAAVTALTLRELKEYKIGGSFLAY